jgi:hypothetical protein
VLHRCFGVAGGIVVWHMYSGVVTLSR